jgi:hypothetical protein
MCVKYVLTKRKYKLLMMCLNVQWYLYLNLAHIYLIIFINKNIFEHHIDQPISKVFLYYFNVFQILYLTFEKLNGMKPLCIPLSKSNSRSVFPLFVKKTHNLNIINPNKHENAYMATLNPNYWIWMCMYIYR